jgi:hypothetical protein
MPVIDETAAESFTTTITIDPSIRQQDVAAELRKVRDVFNYIYRTAMITHNTPVYHPLMQGLAACAINLEQMINTIDPPRVVPGVGGMQPNQIIPGAGRA